MSSPFALSLPPFSSASEDGKTIGNQQEKPNFFLPKLDFTVKINIQPLPLKLENIEENLGATIIENPEQAARLIDKVKNFIHSQPARIHQLFISIIKKFPIHDLILQHMEAHVKTTDEQIQYMDNMITHLQKVSPYLNENILGMQKRAIFIKQMHASFAKEINGLDASSEKIAQAKHFKTILINNHYLINTIPGFNAINETAKTFM